jgi:hypothetical protein
MTETLTTTAALEIELNQAQKEPPARSACTHPTPGSACARSRTIILAFSTVLGRFTV